MGYDLFVFRNVFVQKKDVEGVTTLIGNNRRVSIRECVDTLSGWDIYEIVSNHIENDTQEVRIKTLLEIYKDCRIEPYEKLKEQLELDSKKEGILGVFYEVSQSY